ncbi:hypothetical protein GCM10023235_23060 [Kitasatospora terrestris]|uniref:DUF397 domain-containing protein n=1 Tax=Kitasatospora terrestris TaxID=258051 RepID=A0ABP9DKF0_9ACTN
MTDPSSGPVPLCGTKFRPRRTGDRSCAGSYSLVMRKGPRTGGAPDVYRVVQTPAAVSSAKRTRVRTALAVPPFGV